jgi:hypothetical protein
MFLILPAGVSGEIVLRTDLLASSEKTRCLRTLVLAFLVSHEDQRHSRAVAIARAIVNESAQAGTNAVKWFR